MDEKNGFFIQENNNTSDIYYQKILCNGIFGSKKNTPLMSKWKNRMLEIFNTKKETIGWSEVGCQLLQNIYNSDKNLYENYEIFDGKDNLYPVPPADCVTEFIEKPYENYKNSIRPYQPLIVLVHSVYHKVQHMTEQQILKGTMPLNYFINKSFENMQLIDYDFIEIGTSNFDTLIQVADDKTMGISVDAVKYYIDALPDKPNVKKINVGISDVNSLLNVYYIPEKIIEQHNLPEWFKGCNCINNYHHLHIKHNVSHLCQIEKVKVIPTYELFYKNKARNVKYLKIDTEGHDCIILKTLFFYLKPLPSIFYPNKILFETNEISKPADVDEIIKLFCSLGYKIKTRGYDTILVLC
jgi:hypothetical protein